MLHFIGIVISMFSVMSMQLILVSVMPVISLELGGASLYSWVFSGYMIASLVTIPLFSKLADAYGRRRFYLFSICVFILGSVIGALSASMEQLIFARLVQGAAAGILTPVTISMISGMFFAERRGKMIGYFSLVQLVANIASPLLGEAITGYLNWHWVFTFSILLQAAALLIFIVAGPLKEEKRSVNSSELDIPGGLLFGALSALIVYFFNTFSPELLHSKQLLLCALLIAAAACGLYVVEKRAKSPILRTDFFRTKVLRRAIFSALLAGAVMYGFVNLLPILAGLVVTSVPINAGMVLLSFMLGITAGILLCSRLRSESLSFLLWVLMSAAVLCVMLCLTFDAFHLLLACNVLSGMTLGGITSTALINSQNSVSDADRTVLSGLVQLSRYFGAAVGVAVMIALIPNVNAVGGAREFLGAFGVILAVCALGIVNERV